MKKTIALLLAVLLTALLTFSAAADNTVTETTDENGNPITIVTDEEGNQTIIQPVAPGENDITFDDDELDFEDIDSSGDAAQADDAAEASPAPDAATGGGSGWILPAAIVGLIAVVIALAAVLRKKK